MTAKLIGEALGIVARSKRRRTGIPAEEVQRLYDILMRALVEGDGVATEAATLDQGTIKGSG